MQSYTAALLEPVCHLGIVTGIGDLCIYAAIFIS